MSTLSESTKQFGKKARVLSYSSALMSTAPGKTGIEWDSLEGGEKRDAITKNISEFELYGQSKLVCRSQARLKRQDGHSFVLHP